MSATATEDTAGAKRPRPNPGEDGEVDETPYPINVIKNYKLENLGDTIEVCAGTLVSDAQTKFALLQTVSRFERPMPCKLTFHAPPAGWIEAAREGEKITMIQKGGSVLTLEEYECFMHLAGKGSINRVTVGGANYYFPGVTIRHKSLFTVFTKTNFPETEGHMLHIPLIAAQVLSMLATGRADSAIAMAGTAVRLSKFTAEVSTSIKECIISSETAVPALFKTSRQMALSKHKESSGATVCLAMTIAATGDLAQRFKTVAGMFKDSEATATERESVISGARIPIPLTNAPKNWCNANGDLLVRKKLGELDARQDLVLLSEGQTSSPRDIYTFYTSKLREVYVVPQDFGDIMYRKVRASGNDTALQVGSLASRKLVTIRAASIQEINIPAAKVTTTDTEESGPLPTVWSTDRKASTFTL